MNVSTGNSHILLFERDQQLTALLMSEFQLAGYECHTARTAVEVFDSIARFPVRLVLVNLAQAASARREFWVALDTQRRGRGVQVLTFLCTNLASYGPQDGEERTYIMPVDLHIDGMLGLMSLVQAVRDRLAGVNSATGTHPRMARATNEPLMPPSPTGPFTTSQALDQRPASVASSSTSATNGNNGNAYRNSKADTHPMPVARSNSGIQSASVAAAHQAQQGARTAEVVNTIPTPTMPASPAIGGTNVPLQSYTDKIRAVLYPNQRSMPAQPPLSAATQEINAPTHEIQAAQATETNTSTSDTSMLQQLANGQTNTRTEIDASPANPYESGLDQLSRMVQERRSETTNGYRNGHNYAHIPEMNTLQTMPSSTANTNIPSAQNAGTSTPQYFVNPTPRPVPIEETVSTQTLRASPIQDLPLETHEDYGNRDEGPISGTSRVQMRQPQPPVTPLASITAALPKATLASHVSPPAPPQPQARPTVPMPAIQEAIAETPKQPIEPAASAIAALVQPMPDEETEDDGDDVPTGPLHAEEGATSEKSRDAEIAEPVEQVSTAMQEGYQQQATQANAVANNAMLLDIMQSLPPMPTPSQQPQPQALQGRATRTLGSVLLEGHLVPQSRLEVAQNIQRMLRGVDLNYQLGEILLMFKLLTPDQLLAASLVSYGLLTTQQIVALGRIRQELHAIGLEYDLEALLILFRILTPEQLREVRSSWQS